ncbi:ribosomal protein L1/ribosomal biogenesis protein [Spinellus fusiger]|nr:ribosomal protein L1/ribosomal biogenesis protein [Spinellus fusiger]
MANTFDEQKAKKAIQALYKVYNEKSSTDLLDAEPLIHIQLVTKKATGKKNIKFKRVPLKYSPIPDTADVCLITKKGADKWEEVLKEKNVSRVSKVIDIATLESTYKTFESRRKLAGSYEVFLVEDNVTHLMPNKLGSTFIKRNKMPYSIRLTETGVKEQVTKLLGSTFVRDSGSTSSSAKIGHLGMTEDQVLENLVLAVPAFVNAVAGQWENVLHISLIFQKLPPLIFYTTSSV